MVREFLKSLNSDRVEGELIKTIFYSLLTGLGILLFLYFIRFRYIEDFVPKYGFYLFFAILSYSLILASVRQVRAYKEFACMPGMMIGMTSGMIAGFLPGFYVASTNGMFIGGFFGVFLGASLGVWMGKCCGIMGVMEGIMAGFMGGLMGAMTAFMLLNDNLRIGAVLVFLISSAILFMLNYMIYGEMKENQRQLKEDHYLTIFLTLILTALTTWLVIFGPRGGVFG